MPSNGTELNILYVYPPTDVTYQRLTPPVDKFPYQTRRLALALPLRGLCLPAALARPSSIWNTWSAPRIVTLPMCTPCVRAPAHISIRVPGVRAGGGDVEA